MSGSKHPMNQPKSPSGHHLVRAPSNIALIKYMGKTDASANLPENPSLSMTLHDLATWVSIEPGRKGGGWVLTGELPVGAPASARAPRLSASGIDKVIRHCVRVAEEIPRVFSEQGLKPIEASSDFQIRSANTFPEASGIASSASSFAAITLAVALAHASDPSLFAEAFAKQPALRRSLAKISRRGSGSSCRSFEGPWVEWSGEDAAQVQGVTRMPELAHFVLLISSDSKTVSSSEAHLRVKSSPLWQGRTDRVARRLALLRRALVVADFAALARLAWSEAWEMHSLFHTAAEPFSYWKPGTIETLHWLSPFVVSPPGGGGAGLSESGGAGYADSNETGAIAVLRAVSHVPPTIPAPGHFPVPPIVTLDAGPNVHVTVPLSQAGEWRARFVERFGAAAVLEDRPGSGAEILY